jgi:hypothetical protein
VQVTAPRVCLASPLDGAALRAKVRSLAGEAPDGALDDRRRPALNLLAGAPERSPLK